MGTVAGRLNVDECQFGPAYPSADKGRPAPADLPDAVAAAPGRYQQARVENTFFRYKSIIGDRLRARLPESRETEVIIACNILNRMARLGMSESFPVGV